MLLKPTLKIIWLSKLSKILCITSIIGIITATCYMIRHRADGTPVLPAKIVEIETVAPTPIQKTIQLIGTVRPKHTTILVAKGSGMLDILVTSGQTVKKGDLIAKIINPDIETSYRLSKATAKLANTQFKRLNSIRKTGFVSAREIEEKKQAWINAQKELAKTKMELKNKRFYAPFDGIVGAYKIKEGAQVNESAPVVTIYDPGALTVDVDIPCTNQTQIKVNQLVYVFNKPYHLNHMQRMIDDDTHMCPADIDIVCDTCLIGTNVFVDVVVKQKPNALVLPASALFLKNGIPSVYRINNNKIEIVGVKTGIQEKDKIEIIEGLKIGDQIISKSPERLSPGIEVAIYNPPEDQS